jgi:hypothetical protein
VEGVLVERIGEVLVTSGCVDSHLGLEGDEIGEIRIGSPVPVTAIQLS